MADLSEFEPVTVGRRVYVPLLVLDVDGRRTEFRVPDKTLPPRNSRAVKPYACQECAALVIDPAAHNIAHDGPSCRACGCTEDNACVVDGQPCWWVEPDLCSACAGMQPASEPQVVDLVAALRASVEAAKQRREEAGRG